MFGTSYSTYVRQLDYFQALIIVVLPLNITPYEWLQKTKFHYSPWTHAYWRNWKTKNSSCI